MFTFAEFKSKSSSFFTGLYKSLGHAIKYSLESPKIVINTLRLKFSFTKNATRLVAEQQSLHKFEVAIAATKANVVTTDYLETQPLAVNIFLLQHYNALLTRLDQGADELIKKPFIELATPQKELLSYYKKTRAELTNHIDALDTKLTAKVSLETQDVFEKATLGHIKKEAALKEEITSLTKELAGNQAELQESYSRNAETLAVHHAQRDTIAARDAQIYKLDTELEVLTTSQKELTETNANLTKRCTELTTKFAYHEKHATASADLHKTIKTLSERNAALDDAVSSYSTQISKLNADLSLKYREIDELTKSNTSLAKQETQEITATRQTMALIKRTSATLKAQNKIQEDTILKQKEDIQVLRAQKKLFNESLTKALGSADAKTYLIETQERFEHALKQITTSFQNSRQTLDTITVGHKEMNRLHAVITALQKEIYQTEHKLHEVKEENNALALSLQLPNAPITKSNTDLRPKDNPHRHLTEIKENIGKNNNRIRQIDNKLVEYNTTLEKHYATLKELHATTEAAEKKIADDLVSSEQLLASVNRSFDSFRQAISNMPENPALLEKTAVTPKLKNNFDQRHVIPSKVSQPDKPDKLDKPNKPVITMDTKDVFGTAYSSDPE